ncbi:MAG: EutN/CcmL family microcompartment protein [Holophagae bacterium]|nr:EutN/CcmL family microcompartment protein [Holophagae bacterium]
MIYGKVVGSVWATQKVETLNGLKLLIVQHYNVTGKALDAFTVAVDAVGAGAGEMVLMAQGSSARQTPITEKRPVDTVIMAIVDKLEIES